MKAHRSPVGIGIVLGLLVGAGAAAVIASTSAPERSSPHISSKVVILRGSANPEPGSIERVAAALDMHGVVASDADGWLVRDGDRVLRVRRAANLPWFFSTAQVSCVIVPDAPPASVALQTVPSSGPTECPEATASGEGVSKEDALALGANTLTRAGLGASTTDIVDQPGGWYIQAVPRIEDKAGGGLAWTISIGPGPTITAASGYLAVEDR